MVFSRVSAAAAAALVRPARSQAAAISTPCASLRASGSQHWPASLAPLALHMAQENNGTCGTDRRRMFHTRAAPTPAPSSSNSISRAGSSAASSTQLRALCSGMCAGAQGYARRRSLHTKTSNAAANAVSSAIAPSPTPVAAADEVTHPSPIQVLPLANGQLGVIAARSIHKGETLISLKQNRVKSTPDRYTVQLTGKRHIAGDDLGLAKYLNHHCAPNAKVLIQPVLSLSSNRMCGRGDADEDPIECSVVALQPIPAGAEVTFNYLTTELDMDEKFECNCGSPGCFRVIAGFRHLTPAQQHSLADHISPFLKTMLEQ